MSLVRALTLAMTVLVSALLVPEAYGYCADSAGNCPVNIGYCINPIYLPLMGQHCRATCGHCADGQEYGNAQSALVVATIKAHLANLVPEAQQFIQSVQAHMKTDLQNLLALPPAVKQELKATFPLTTALSENPIAAKTVQGLVLGH
ncbi:hypothetical protein AAVH_17691 [Aphelenchoides avenae]|nr:hypothetical protein AAVH_17691 [Aphelenchus avenae]